MKKIIYVVFFTVSVLYTGGLLAQSSSVPSPSSSQMTRYAESSVNESSGRITASVPIYNFQAGNLTLPIGLSYVGNGVKIDQQSNWVGTNWNLQAGGVVTRIVNHLPDETATNRLFLSDANLLIETTGGANTQYIQDLVNGVNLEDDLRPDIFSFSFPGYSGSFYLDQNNEPRLVADNVELKIEWQASPTTPTLLNTILITTPSGIKYYFGGDDASESTAMTMDDRDRWLNSTNTPDFVGVPNAITAFYLYKIEHPFGDEILLEYYDDGDQTTMLFYKEQITKLKSKIPNDLDEFCATSLDGNPTNIVKQQFHWIKVFNRKKIKKIFSPNTFIELNFNSNQLVLDSPAGEDSFFFEFKQYDDRILNSIQVFNTQLNENIKQVSLGYIMTPYRFFLEKVTMNNENDLNSIAKCSTYKMEYNDISALPSRFSNAQDLLGYFNGILTNTSSLAITDENIFDPLAGTLADRSSVFDAASKGALIRMYSPSGGHTLFEYESPRVKTLTPHTSEFNLYRNQPITLSNKLRESKSFNYNSYQTPINYTQEVKLNITAKLTDLNSSFENEQVHIQLFNTVTNNPILISEEFMTLSSGQSNIDGVFTFTLEKDKLYDIVITIDPNGENLSNAPTILKATAEYVKLESFEASGLRIARVSDYTTDSENITETVKRYYYKRAEIALSQEEDEQSSVVTYEVAKQLSSSEITHGCCPLNDLGTNVYSYVSLLSDPSSNYFAASDNQVSYKYVTVSYGGDFFDEGGVEKQFKIERTKEPELISIPDIRFNYTGNANWQNSGYFFFGNFQDNNTIFNGALLNKIDYQNDLGTLRKIMETNYSYTCIENYKTEGMILSPHTDLCVAISENAIYETALASYNNISYSFNLTNIKTKEYFPKIKQRQGLEEPIKYTPIVSTTKDIEYNSLRGMPTKITSINSDGEINTIKNYYLTDDDINTISASSVLTPTEETAYQSLIAQHRIGGLIQTESYITKENSIEELRSRQRILYDNDFNGLTLQKEVQTSKLNSTLETRSTYHQYDDKGYVLEMSSDNNVTTSIIYGYKDKKIIAQLINVTHAELLSVVDNLHNLSNLVIDDVSMNELEAALDLLRTDFPNGQISTYVYNRLGQLSSMKDTRGYKMTYEYDDCYRLSQVKDHQGNILQEHEYNIINNNN